MSLAHSLETALGTVLHILSFWESFSFITCRGDRRLSKACCEGSCQLRHAIAVRSNFYNIEPSNGDRLVISVLRPSLQGAATPDQTRRSPRLASSRCLCQKQRMTKTLHVFRSMRTAAETSLHVASRESRWLLPQQREVAQTHIYTQGSAYCIGTLIGPIQASSLLRMHILVPLLMLVRAQSTAEILFVFPDDAFACRFQDSEVLSSSPIRPLLRGSLLTGNGRGWRSCLALCSVSLGSEPSALTAAFVPNQKR